jgi:predicted aspartyl protease
MRFESFFETDGDLIVVEVVVVDPRGADTARLILDTGAALTTVIPPIAEAIGYTAADRIARSIVRSAAAEEHGYILRIERVTALGIELQGVHVNVAELGHRIDGLLGMNFLTRSTSSSDPPSGASSPNVSPQDSALPTFAEAVEPASLVHTLR